MARRGAGAARFACPPGAPRGMGGNAQIVIRATSNIDLELPYAVGASLIAAIATSSGAVAGHVKQGLAT